LKVQRSHPASLFSTLGEERA